MSTNIERRSTGSTGTLRATTRKDGGSTIGGLAIPVGVRSEDLGGFFEFIGGGAFTASIKDGDPRCLSNHDSNFLLGRVSAGTLRLSEGERGISYECDLPDTERAREVAESIRRRDISGNSFAMHVIDDTWEETPDGLIRTVNRAELRELGPQPWPAYATSSVDVRSLADTLAAGRKCVGASCLRGGQDPNVLLRELELSRRGRTRTGGSYSDVLALLRELDDRPAPKVDAVQRAREWPSQSEYTRHRSNSFTGHACRATAYHEAGHAVHALLDGCRLDELSLLWTRERNNGTWKFRGGECVTRGGTDTPAMHLAGRVATELAGLGEALPKSWSAVDHKRAHGCTKQGVRQDRQAATALLTRHWGAVKALAAALLERQRIDGDEAERIILEQCDLATRTRLKRVA